MIDLNTCQQVEGFSRLLSTPFGDHPLPGHKLGPDHRGESEVGTTGEWWRKRAPEEPDLEWLTADVPKIADTTFTFIGESSNLPENLSPPNQAALYVNDRRVLTFELGQRSRCVWTEGEWVLEFVPTQVHATYGVYDRQVYTGVCGTYRLGAPAHALRKGQPLRIKVVLVEPKSDSINWFAVRHRTDTLELNPRTNSEQIARLQEEVIELKRTVGVLARRSYGQLFHERLDTEDFIVYANGRSHVHEPDLIRLRNGDLLVCLREASEHISCDGKMVMVRSSDEGKTWGQSQVLREYPGTDERSASFCQLRDGTLLSNALPQAHYDRYGRFLSGRNVDSGYQGRPWGIYIGRSTDNGFTWTWSEKGIDTTPFREVATAEHIVELESGQLLMACYAPSADDATRYISIAYASDDKGQTWHYLSTFGDVPGDSLVEPSLIQTQTGRLISIIRNQVGHAYYQAMSDDGGVTWTPACPSQIPGRINPASLVQLPSGTILCVHGSRSDPSGIYVVASYDDGETWDIANRKVIRDDLLNWDIGYPSNVIMPDGRVLTVYYFNLFHRFFIVGSVFRWE